MSTNFVESDLFKATVISVYPLPIHEFKPGIIPSDYKIDPCINDVPEILVVSESVHYVSLDGVRKIKVRTPAVEIAASVVNDFCNSQLGVSDEEKPGIFFVPLVIKKEEVEKKCTAELKAARAKQDKWFRKLVQLGDDDWTRYHRNTVISDLQRLAAKRLGLDREWTQVVSAKIPVICPSCKTGIDPEAVVCPICKCVMKPLEFNKLTFATK